MYRTVLTLLVGLMLSVGGGAGALTFKSDGTIVQGDGNSSPAADRKRNEAVNWSDFEVCAASEVEPKGLFRAEKYSKEVKRRRIDCHVFRLEDDLICDKAIGLSGSWTNENSLQDFVREAKRRHLSCADEMAQTKAKLSPIVESVLPNRFSKAPNHVICLAIQRNWEGKADYISEANKRRLRCINDALSDETKRLALSAPPDSPSTRYEAAPNHVVCLAIRKNWADKNKYIAEAELRGLDCGVDKNVSAQKKVAAKAAQSTEELKAERLKRIQLEQELAALKAQRKQQQQSISADNQVPLINIVSATTAGKQGVIEGYVTDNSGVAEVSIDGTVVPVSSDGSFEYSTFVPANGISLQVQATDLAGLTSVMSVSLERSASTATAAITFDRLNPLGKKVAENRNALALIVGVSDYENTPAKAIFADSDALMFRDYASEKLGVPENRIRTLVDDGADERQLLLSVKNWLSRAIRQNQSDVYLFFAGHGLASDDGEKMYLLPYDGAPELLENTAILRDELFADITQAKPRSVTVFLDTCYSGTTRGPDMLIASRPIAIRAKEQAVPEGFTVMTAAAGDQTAKPLEEAKHGMFSYFLMKGMEGDADANQDNQITAGELHAYVQQNVIQQSSGSQTPELQGDADRVLVRFQ